MLCGLILAVGCTYDSDIDTSGFGSEGDGVTTVNIRATLPEFGGVTRGVDSAQGGTTNIDWEEYRLRVIIKALGDESEPEEYRGKEAASEVLYLDDTDVGADGSVAISLDMPLTSGHTYDIYMWADYVQKGSTEDLHYDTGRFPAIALKHDVPVINDETLDAFYGKAEITVGDGYYVWAEGTQFPISRAVAKLRMVATDADSASAARATLQTDMFYTGFNIATGELTKSAAAVKSEMTTFETYTEETTPTTKSFITAYMLWPAEQSTNIVAEFYDGNDTVISTIQPADAIPLKRGNLTTLRGALLVTDSGWDGEVEQPEVLGDTLVVSTPGQLLWLVENGAKVGDVEYRKIRLGADINVNNQVDISPLKLYDDTDFDGNGKALKGLGVPTTALFGSVQGLRAYNFTLEGYNVSAQDGHVGVLVNELHKSATFADITIKNSTAKTSNGAAGGVVGYVGGGSSVDLDVVFTNCDLVNVKADGTSAEGKFVGLMQGYNNGETLSFDADCSADDACGVADYASPYTESNDAQWLDGDVATYPKSFDFSAYNGWLGDEEMYRAIVTFAGNRMQIKWDGVTTVEPLLANPSYDTDVTSGTNKFVVYSPFDLAGVRSKTASPAAIYLRSDIDMNGQGADGKYNVPSNFTQSKYTSTDDNVFNPFSYVTTLDGKKDGDNNYSIYNLSIEQIEQERAAFIIYASGTTSHKNINFRSCQTVAVHKPVATDAKAYGAILVANVDATYTMENVHAHDCRVFALQKVGTLGARISGTSTLKNCTVNNCYVENYECMISERFESGSKTMAGVTIENVYADFYPHGEVGGMFGFIQGNSSITNCLVNGTTIYAFGQDDKNATIKGKGLLGYLAAATLQGLGYYKVPGRHVSTLIGNIRATGTVTLTGCSVDANTKCPHRHDKHNSTYNYIGQAYIVKFVDDEGSVTVDGSKLTLADCNRNTRL